ncbi:MAG: hypothetical protein HPY76_09455 [Anaerolineae bacterium]|nr:hypothetical protein [Anaerolineae bacterium]
MDKQQRSILWYLIGAALVLFLFLALPNQTGARDINMLSIFEVDEFAQYPHVLDMLTPGDSAYQTLRNFLIYQHYFYGFPFYFVSALALLPAKLALGAGWAQHTTLLVTILRQMVNVLPMLAALIIWVYLQTRFHSHWRSLALFALLAIVPAVVLNNLWWHHDSLAFLLVTLVFFFLDRDRLRFGWNFILAGLVCGVAVSVRYAGAFFALAVPLYLVWGVVGKHIKPARGLLMGGAFVLVMALGLAGSNPLLLLPQERAEIIATQQLQFQQTGRGIILASEPTLAGWQGYPQDLQVHYGDLLFVLLAGVGLALGLRDRAKRLHHSLLLAYLIPITAVTLASATGRTHYYLPILLPLFSCLINIFDDNILTSLRTIERGLVWLTAAVITVQAVLFLQTDYKLLNQQLTRERNSPSIQFYQQVAETGLPVLDRRLAVYRDWKAYVPDIPAYRVEMDWNLGSYDMVANIDPDLILLEQENIDLFSSQEALQRAAEPEVMQARHAFYSDAAAGELRGYHLLYRNDFGAAFISDAFTSE